ncbi:hypothetical protein [Litorivicinus lipolyticus]|jgi:hypothetical protein|uniref:hypothetical protein n=1 Tax=Litorivicinus lipolyticus TaxID=418701 RepID=UPI003B5A4685
MRRLGIVALALIVVGLLIADLSNTPPNPYQAPDPLAWGSKDGASGAFCSFTGQ